MKNLLLLICLVLCGVVLRAQEECFVLKGRIVERDSLRAIANANIVCKLSHYGTASNQEGHFIIKALKTDTLKVSCVGFVKEIVPVLYDSVCDKSLIISMERDTILLNEVDILGLPDYDEFIKGIAKLPQKKPFFVPGVTKDGLEELIYKRPEHEPKASSINPISLIYNRFNKREVLRRKMLRNRKRYIKELKKAGMDSLILDFRP